MRPVILADQPLQIVGWHEGHCAHTGLGNGECFLDENPANFACGITGGATSPERSLLAAASVQVVSNS